ncbi:MAG: helix-turn-helix domain-containing protein [Rhodospirillaceae bacterium]|nr:helix-turn-helix domain-containing protein [Rhodospirillaceae bacterium]
MLSVVLGSLAEISASRHAGAASAENRAQASWKKGTPVFLELKFGCNVPYTTQYWHFWIVYGSFMGARSIEYDTAEAAEATRIGELIRRARVARNISQGEMAQRTGVTRKTFAALEQGSPTVALGVFVRALDILGFKNHLSSTIRNALHEDDLVGLSGRKRAGSKHDAADF